MLVDVASQYKNGDKIQGLASLSGLHSTQRSPKHRCIDTLHHLPLNPRDDARFPSRRAGFESRDAELFRCTLLSSSKIKRPPDGRQTDRRTNSVPGLWQAQNMYVYSVEVTYCVRGYSGNHLDIHIVPSRLLCPIRPSTESEKNRARIKQSRE